MSSSTASSAGFGPAFFRIFSLHYLPALVAIVAMVGVMVYADWQHQVSARAENRDDIAEELGVIRARLESAISNNVEAIRGMAAVVGTEPDMNQARYDQLAKRILDGKTQFRAMVAAPNFVVSLVYPLKGNEKALGLDYLKDKTRRAAALLVRDTNRAVVTGPLDMGKNHEGLFARVPVMVDAPDGSRRFWGLVSGVMNLQSLYRDSGLLALKPSVEVSISKILPSQDQASVFYGDADVLKLDPVQLRVRVGYEDWLISAAPTSGWDLSFAQIWRFRLILLIGEFIIILPMIWTGKLMEERQRNIRTLEQRDEQMRRLSQRLQIALETSKIGIWEYDIDDRKLIWDARMHDLYGVPSDYMVSSYDDWAARLHPDDVDTARDALTTSIESGGEYRGEFRVVASDGSIRHIRAIGTSYHDTRSGRKVVGVNWDVSVDIRLQADLRDAKLRADEQNRELEKARVEMESAALHDALTELPNRRYLDQIMVDMDAMGHETPVTVLHIDLDRFKDINDTLGHAAGDLILRHAAETLRHSVRDGDFLARIGGDEFVIISHQQAGDDDFADMATRLVEAISKPVFYEGHECRIGASIGIAARADGEMIDQLLINADIALYEAKRRGRNRVEKFSDALKLVAVSTKKTADEILRGLEQNEFMAWFQPQFDAHTLEIVGIEALARWDHPTKGILAPDSFLKIAESLKVVAMIDDVVLTQALLQRYRLEANGIHIPTVAVNISAQRLREETLIDRLKSFSFTPGTLAFEMLESISFDGHDGELMPQIEKIRELGIDIDIDDFGTGYASIVTLLKLTPRRLKIDRQLIAPIVDSVDQQRLVRSIIDIGKARGIEIVAEGVETMEHVAILRDLGCDVLQGYALSKPLSPADLLRFAQERKWLDHAPPVRIAS